MLGAVRKQRLRQASGQIDAHRDAGEAGEAGGDGRGAGAAEARPRLGRVGARVGRQALLGPRSLMRAAAGVWRLYAGFSSQCCGCTLLWTPGD